MTLLYSLDMIGILLNCMPQFCGSCDAKLSIELLIIQHSFSWISLYKTQRHKVEVDPKLQPISGEHAVFY